MSVVFDRPYEFIPPHTGNLWPTLIQRLRLYDLHLRFGEGIVDHSIAGLDNFADPLRSGDGVLLAPNHCRYADPLVLGWPARELGTHLHALASWHLFNKSRFDQFAIRRMGAFSLNREQVDRTGLDYAINVLADATRPLIIFPEGATYRTNDYLKPLADGITFIARAAARRAAKKDRKVQMIPVAMKYTCVDPPDDWVDAQLRALETRFGWRRGYDGGTFIQRLHRVHDAYLGTIEARFGVATGPTDDVHARREHLIDQLLHRSESFFETPRDDVDDPAVRARAIRTEVASDYFARDRRHTETELRHHSAAADVVLDLAAHPPHYLDPDQITDTRLVETIQRMQESMDGKSNNDVKLKVHIEFHEPIEVPPEKAPRRQTDPLLTQLDETLRRRLADLSCLARPLSGSS